MSIFGNILGKIFHHKAAASPAATSQPAEAPSAPVAAPAAAPAQTEAQPASLQAVDVEVVLVEMASMKDGGGNWRTSIVDLLKLLDLDSSLTARKALGDELGVLVGEDGSAEQNIALHKAVMAKLAENGGIVPDDLRN